LHSEKKRINCPAFRKEKDKLPCIQKKRINCPEFRKEKDKLNCIQKRKE
jgi:hypothetical protein